MKKLSLLFFAAGLCLGMIASALAQDGEAGGGFNGGASGGGGRGLGRGGIQGSMRAIITPQGMNIDSNGLPDGVRQRMEEQLGNMFNNMGNLLGGQNGGQGFPGLGGLGSIGGQNFGGQNLGGQNLGGQGGNPFDMIGNLLGNAISGQTPGQSAPPDKLALANQRNVQRELEMTDKQVEQVAQRLEKSKELRSKLTGMTPDEREAEKTRQDKADDSWLSTTLGSARMKRLKEIAIQQRGIRALTDADTAKALNLSNDQKRRLQEALDGNTQEVQRLTSGLFGGNNAGAPPEQQDFIETPRPGAADRPAADAAKPAEQPERAEANDEPAPAAAPANPLGGLLGGLGNFAPMMENMQKLSTMNGSLEESMLEVLTPSQKTKWTSLQGEPFKGAINNGMNFNMNFSRGNRQQGGGRAPQ